MNEMYESCAEDGAELEYQLDRLAEYEKKTLSGQPQPLLAAMFLLYFLISITLVGVVAYWLFY